MLALFTRLHVRAAAARILVGCLAAALAGGAAAQAAMPQSPPPENSALDAPLFYQLLIGEMELRNGEAGNAYQVLLDAARRTRDEALFKRTVEIALQARAGEQALAATRAWRTAVPDSVEALRFQVQLLVVLNRIGEVAEPLRTLIEQTPVVEQPGLIASLPRFFQRVTDKRQTAEVFEVVLQKFVAEPGTRTASRITLGRAWLAADNASRAFELTQRAHTADPGAPAPAMLALELLPTTPAAEAVVTDYLRQPKPEPVVRLAYVRALSAGQRYTDATAQLEVLTREQPDLQQPWLSLGALKLELKQPQEAETALLRFVALHEAAPPPPAPATAGLDADEDEDPESDPAAAAAGSASDDGALMQAWLLLAQAAEQRNDFKAAEAWLAKVDSPQRALEVQARRAALLARQGQMREARELIHRVPERTPDDARSKLLVEAQILRDVKQWRDAYEVLAEANRRFPGDADLLYEQAMTAEKLDRVDEMERLLRQVITVRPDYHHAYNALGYSLADRGQRLPEARELIARALELSPGDPFITDSLGWVEYRLGNSEEAVRLLRKAYAARPDTEIATHLGEVLWSMGRRDEARGVLRDARSRDGSNELLRDTLARLKVDL